MRMEKKTVLITGGTSGIGFAAAKRMIEEGATVAITGRNNETLQESARQLGKGAHGYRIDSADISAIAGVVEQMVEELGMIDAAFLNAGDASYTPLGATSEADFDHLIAVNLKSPFFFVQALLPYLSRNASIVLNSSVGNTIGVPAMGAYAASKAGLVGMSKCMASELSSRAIRVNVVSPGNIKTPFWKTVASEEQMAAVVEFATQSIPLERFGEAEEIANVVLFLCSSESSYIHGTELYVDGGITGAMMGAPAYKTPSM